jgi:YD repeat-containing protein
MKYLFTRGIKAENNKSFLKLFLAASMTLLSYAAFAQLSQVEQSTINKLIPQPLPKSPNVAALGKFGDYSVNYFTGVPDISIPIFEVVSGELSVPITLSYHASGIKPSDVASWVGMEWSLSAGGNVSRSVLGKRDEEDYYTRTLVQNPDACNDFSYLKQAALSVIDTEPDVFSYSQPGASGKFMLIEGGTPYLIPSAPHIIKTEFTTNEFKKFEITNEHGVLHRFGVSSDQRTSKEFTSSVSGGNPTLGATTAWHLMEMVAPNSDDQINFYYQDAGMCTMNDVSYHVTTQDQGVSFLTTCPESPPIITESSAITTSMNQEAISTIVYKKGKVEFVMGGLRSDQTALHSLDFINVYSLVNGQYSLLKTIKFVYSYYTNDVSQNVRLKLDGLQFIDGSGTVVQNYKFSYFTNQLLWNSSHENFQNARDLWGYYNGETRNTDLINRKQIFYTPNNATQGAWIYIGGAMNRTVNTTHIKDGILKRIDFPTGGYTEFDFEPNRYYDYYNAPGTPTLAGGLRVTSITSSDGTNSLPVVKRYSYGSNGVYGSGIGIANFSQYSYNYKSVQTVHLKACSQDMPSYRYVSTTYYSNSAFATDAFDSSPVLYPNVTEYFGDPSGKNNGRIEYEFDKGLPQTDNDQVVASSSKYYRDSYFWKRGKLTRKVAYDNVGNKLSETLIDYAGIQANAKIIGLGAFQANLYLGPYCNFPGAICYTQSGDIANPADNQFSLYFQHSGAWLESKVTNYSYNYNDVNNYVKTETSKDYDPNKLQVLQTIVTGTNNEQVVTVNRYPFQIPSSSASAGNALGLKMLNDKNIVSMPIESYSYRQNTEGSNSRIIAGQLTTYRQNSSNANFVVPDQIYLLDSPVPIPTTTYSSVTRNGSSNDLVIDLNQKKRINMLEYDSHGNLLSVSKSNDIIMSYQYGYNHALPIAEVKNALNISGTEEIFCESFEESNSASVIINPSLAHAGKCYFNSAGYATTFTPPNSKNYKLEYWYLNNGKWNYKTSPYTGAGMILNDGSAIDDVRIYPTNAYMKSYTYDPVLGMTSVIDEGGILQSYYYDKFGRLISIKDNDKNLLKTYKYHYRNSN